MSKADLRIVFYRGNSYPRALAVDPGKVIRVFVALALSSLVLLGALGLLIRWTVRHQVTHGQGMTATSQESVDQYGPFNSAEEQGKKLKDDVERLEARIRTLTAEKEAPKEIDSRNPVLALFSPVITDQTKSQQLVVAKNFSFSPGAGKEPMTLSFELHNSEPGSSVQKGYIVVLARGRNTLKAYPDVFNPKGAYLLDFERGESFQVSRFRVVNAQFDAADTKDPVTHFQIMIFKRTGELLLNLLSEVKGK